MKTETQGWHRYGLIGVAALAVAGAVWLQCIGAWQDSQTTDEGAHLAAGLSYWRTGHVRLNPEHPPLIKLLAAWPLVPLPRLNLDTNWPPQTIPNEWQIGANLLYQPSSLTTGRIILWLGRWPMIGITGLLGWVIWWWSRRLWGVVGAWFSTILFLYDPNFLGHGHLVTTDVGAALAYVGTVCLATRFFQLPSKKRLLWLAIVFGLAQVTKFSMVFLWLVIPCLGLIALWAYRRSFTSAWWWRMIGSLIIASAIITWASYFFEIQRPISDPWVIRQWQQRSILAHSALNPNLGLVRRLVVWSDPSIRSGQWLKQISRTPIPAWQYWRGLIDLFSHNYWGHAAYLNGQFSYFGWWWYFPEAVAIKTPIPTLVFAVFGFGVFLFSRLRYFRRPGSWFFILPPLLYFLWSMSGHINIGLRHIFPIYPFLFIGLGGTVPLIRQLTRVWPVILGIMLAWSIGLALMAYPHTIGYFNALAGGTNGGHNYLLDSNLDWNQDIWRLRHWLDADHVHQYSLVLFGSIPQSRIFPEATSVLTDADIQHGLQPRGVVIISAGQLYNPPGPFHWLQSIHPTGRIGSSILVFDFR